MSTTSVTESTPSGKTKGKPPISRSYDHREVSLHSICYVAALTRFALNSQPEWDDKDCKFYGRKFFNAAQTILMRNEEFTNELLVWWNEYAILNGESVSDPEEAPDTDTAFTRMLARDEARKAARATESTAKPARKLEVTDNQGDGREVDVEGEDED
ncbi:hypothetical protein BN946_scf184709.g8 [Trametes cinnabarina]|uniref:Uncharacterized protein n=1 Tax=Pycnoporus cinnabarinus TaxID=5643 RepID=A0A060SS06_PYCCI|nr:hypothetical protein BN946_scf184709.g8 [Trametes cinnabarina]